MLSSAGRLLAGIAQATSAGGLANGLAAAGCSRLAGLARAGLAGDGKPRSVAWFSSDKGPQPGPTPSAPNGAEQPPGAPNTESQPQSTVPPGPASRRDAGAAAETIYPSSHDDNMGVQKNWFNALLSQLNVVHRTGVIPHMKGRQKEIFVAVEREFEGLWERHVKGKGLTGTAHRGMLLCCLAIATHKVLRYESGDDELVKEVVNTNLGGLAVGIMKKLHSGRLWVLLRLLAEDPYTQAVRFLPSLQNDLSSLVQSDVDVGESEATWTTTKCCFYEVLSSEGVPELLPEFCCQYSMQWMEEFSKYGVRVGLEQSLGFGDEQCCVRISKRLPPGQPGPPGAQAQAQTGTGADPQSGAPPPPPPPQA
ncbi:hypothetical protein HYH03_017933 [Edaphochlamys debaryana]|uniref:Uncharacterized protein n=1 Tax=Edaphochlamys debaryana TaxID=47281 RepID=A0A835XFM8_9CHLO|nr:hypothetical protein HYH03_017933 [Edaphochlamys debaryana]|eukprot:KAG2483198.1 hypothetical protein HYH03_017933 [Edaphochlamys debaryana]